MSDLYQSPAEVVQETNRRTKGGTHFGADWFTDRVREGTRFNPDTQEFDRTGWAFWGDVFGMTNPEGNKAIEEGIIKRRDAEKIQTTLESAPGVTTEQLEKQLGGKKLTAKNVRGVVAEAVRERRDKPTPLQQSQIERGIKSDERQATALEQQNTLAQQQLAATIAQGNQSHSLALMQLADSSDARAAELTYQKMRDRKADLQYNERMEQLDRKDRRQAMSAIAAGLASLGAAFAM